MSIKMNDTQDGAVVIAERFGFKLTSLREQIINLLLQQVKPIKAYDLLAKLKAIRPSAKPPTVYRVLDFLVEHKAVIRLEACNSYILSAVEKAGEFHNSRMTMVFRSRIDGKWVQFSDPSFDQLVLDWENKHNLRLDSGVIELQGEFLPDDRH
jgi:Fur family zinc uptake transcriptional regulator